MGSNWGSPAGPPSHRAFMNSRRSKTNDCVYTVPEGARRGDENANRTARSLSDVAAGASCAKRTVPSASAGETVTETTVHSGDFAGLALHAEEPMHRP